MLQSFFFRYKNLLTSVGCAELSFFQTHDHPFFVIGSRELNENVVISHFAIMAISDRYLTPDLHCEGINNVQVSFACNS
jgi:hypothetical protein